MIERHELTELVGGDNFKAAIRDVTDIETRHGYEAGFAVYETDQGLTISEVVSDVGMDTDSFEIGDSLFAGHTSIRSMSPLIFDPIAGGVTKDIYRNDIAMTIHSHPSDVAEANGRSVTELLRPSIPDLEGFEKVDARNPGHVEGIIVVEHRLAIASLLLYRRTNPNRPNMYQQLDDEDSQPSRRTVLGAMADSGINSTELNYDLRAGDFRENVDEQVSRLYEQS